MKKLYFLFLIFFSTNSFSQSFTETKPIWDQFNLLICKKTKDISCISTSCSTTSSDWIYELDFKKNQMRYIGKHNLTYKILDKFFKSKDKVYTRVVNSLSLDGFTITLFNFESPDLVGNPEFVSVQSQISLVPKSESDITSITSYAKCYPKL